MEKNLLFFVVYPKVTRRYHSGLKHAPHIAFPARRAAGFP